MDLSFESDEIEGSKERVLSCAAVSVMGKRVNVLYVCEGGTTLTHLLATMIFVFGFCV